MLNINLCLFKLNSKNQLSCFCPDLQQKCCSLLFNNFMHIICHQGNYKAHTHTHQPTTAMPMTVGHGMQPGCSEVALSESWQHHICDISLHQSYIMPINVDDDLFSMGSNLTYLCHFCLLPRNHCPFLNACFCLVLQ